MTSVNAPTTRPGLDDVVAAETRLSHVDGAHGQLILAGLTLGQAVDLGFEAMAARLWGVVDDETPPPKELSRRLGEARAAAFRHLAPMLAATSGLPPIDALRAMVAALADRPVGEASGVEDAIRVTAAMGVMVPALARRAGGADPVAPDPGLGHAADLVRMLHDREPDPAATRALDAYLTTALEHGLNASTFTARVVASTRAGMVAAVAGALAALKGPLHGGAPGPVLDMLEGIGEPAAARAWLEARLAEGERIMGFGHRIYRVRDPRADVLKPAVVALDSPFIRLAEAVEREALDLLATHRPDRPLEINLEFWTALLLDAIGFDRSLFTPVFACGRAVGWSAHVIEQERTGRLIRPLSTYAGDWPAQAA